MDVWMVIGGVGLGVWFVAWLISPNDPQPDAAAIAKATFLTDLFEACRSGVVEPSSIRQLAQHHSMDDHGVVGALTSERRSILTNRSAQKPNVLESIDRFLAHRDTDQLLDGLPDAYLKPGVRLSVAVGSNRDALNDLLRTATDAHQTQTERILQLQEQAQSLDSSRSFWRTVATLTWLLLVVLFIFLRLGAFQLPMQK